jgi:hypothetical protein
VWAPAHCTGERGPRPPHIHLYFSTAYALILHTLHRSVAGIANNECLPIAGFGGEKGVAFMMDCRDNGDVVMNAYNANDCSGYALV